MKMTHCAYGATAAAALLLGAATTGFADDTALLKDPGFELVLDGDEGGWRTFDISNISDDQARTGSRSMFNAGFSRTVSYPPYFLGQVSGSYQELPATAGSRWRLTGYAMTAHGLKGSPAFGILQVSFFDAEGNDLGTVETAADDDAKAKTSNELTGRAPTGEWIFLDTGVATAPEGTHVIQAFTLYVDYSGSGTSQGVYFDDLDLCALGDGEDACD